MVIFGWCNQGKRWFHYVGFNVKTFWEPSSPECSLCNHDTRNSAPGHLCKETRHGCTCIYNPYPGWEGVPQTGGLLRPADSQPSQEMMVSDRRYPRPSLSSLHTRSQEHTHATCIYLPHTQREKQKGKKNLVKEQGKKGWVEKSREKGKIGSCEHVTSHLSRPFMHIW